MCCNIVNKINLNIFLKYFNLFYTKLNRKIAQILIYVSDFPPSTGNKTPVINSAKSDAKNAIAVEVS